MPKAPPPTLRDVALRAPADPHWHFHPCFHDMLLAAAGAGDRHGLTAFLLCVAYADGSTDCMAIGPDSWQPFLMPMLQHVEHQADTIPALNRPVSPPCIILAELPNPDRQSPPIPSPAWRAFCDLAAAMTLQADARIAGFLVGYAVGKAFAFNAYGEDSARAGLNELRARMASYFAERNRQFAARAGGTRL